MINDKDKQKNQYVSAYILAPGKGPSTIPCNPNKVNCTNLADAMFV